MKIKTWRDDNYLSKLRESEEEALKTYDAKEELIRLICGEAAAAVQYEFAANSILGPDQSYLVEHFKEHASEEWGHYRQLVGALMQREGKASVLISDMVNKALPETKELESVNSEYLRSFFVESEDSAIKAYEDFYNHISEDADLADIVSGIISDERDHKLDFERIVKEG